jgi:hypothetical protein
MGGEPSRIVGDFVAYLLELCADRINVITIISPRLWD